MTQKKPNVLVVLSSHAPGWYLPEFAHPYDVLAPHCEITVASHLGGHAPVDEGSIKGFSEDESCVTFLKDHESLWKNTIKLEDLAGSIDKFDAIFYVGGYGPMFDLVSSKASADIISEFYTKNKLITGICHGPAVLAHLDVPGSNKKMLEGHKVTGISNVECETLLPMTGIVEPWSVEDELKKSCGGKYEKAAEQFHGHVVVSSGADGRTIITGQNPASGKEFGKALLKHLIST